MKTTGFATLFFLFNFLNFASTLYGQSGFQECRPLNINYAVATVGVIEHDSGAGDGRVKIILSDPGQPGSISIYRGVPDLINHSNRILLRAYGSLSDIFIIDGLETGFYQVRVSGSTSSGGGYGCVFLVRIYRTGCTDPTALNYDPDAVIDDGSCIYQNDVCPTGVHITSVLPDCGETNGSISISSGGGTGLQYSIDGGSTFHAGGFFDGLSVGEYSIVVRKSGCSNATREYVLSCDQNTTCPEITNVRIVNQPSACGIGDGTITVQSTGSNKEFSIDGGSSWKTFPTFTGLAAGSYTVDVRNRITHCGESSSFALVCTPTCSDGRQNGTETGPDCGGSCAPCCPEDITVDVQTYPYCDPGSTGSFMVRARGVNLQFSINGSSYQDSPVFSNITAGTYTIHVRSTSTRCVRTSNFDFVCAATCPDIASTEIEAPNCEVPESGLLTITLGPGQGNNPKATGGSDPSTPVYEYSIDGGSTWSGEPSFAVGGGSYTVVVRNNETDCTVGDILTIPCVGCFDGIKNGDETDVDCGGVYCHSCTCPSVADIKASEAQANSGSGGRTGDGGTGGVGGAGGGLGGQSGGDDSGTFICDLPEYYDCPNCISYRSCHDDLDNDGDELCDCEDGDCSTWYDVACVKPIEECGDGVDNDGDDLIDCADAQCDNSFECQGVGESLASELDIEIRREIFLNEHGHLNSFLAVRGIPHWEKSLRLGPIGSTYPKVVPVSRPLSNELTGILFIDNRDEIRYRFYSREEIDEISGKKSSDASDSPDSSTMPLLDKVRIVGMFHQLQANMGGTLDPYHNQFLERAPTNLDGSIGRMPGCDRYQKCVTLPACTIRDGCPNDPDAPVERLPERELCWYVVDCPRGDDGIFDGRSSGGISTTSGGGSSSTTRNTGSESFNDKINSCADGGGPNDAPNGGGEATVGQAFCDAVTRIIYECDRFNLGSVEMRNVLEILHNKPDQNQTDPESDDDGMLTEVADYVCENGASGMTTAVIEDYAAYAVMVGLTNADDFDAPPDDDFSGFSGRSFCFERVGESWTAVTTDINFHWKGSSLLGLPSRSHRVTITVTIPRTRFNGPYDIIESHEAANAAVDALNSVHTTLLTHYGLSRTWMQVGRADIEAELAELMEIILLAQFGYAKLDAGETAPGVKVCKAVVF